jgi:ribonuclease Z
MAVSTGDAWSVPGDARQPPPEKGGPNPMSDEMEKGRWVPAFKAQDRMLDEHMKKYQLEKQDWRPAMYESLGVKYDFLAVRTHQVMKPAASPAAGFLTD